MELLFSPSGKKIAYRDYSYRVKVYDALSLKLNNTINHGNHSNNKLLPISLLDYSPDDSTFLSSYQIEDEFTNTHRHFGLMSAVWGDSVLDFKAPVRFSNPRGSFIPGKQLAICGDYKTKKLFIFNILTGDTLRSFDGPAGQKFSAVSADGTHILSSDNNDDIYLLSTENGVQENRLRGHSGYISTLDVSGDGDAAVTTNLGGGNAKIWDLTTGLLTGTLDLDSGSFSQAVFTTDKSGVVTVTSSGDVALWDLQSHKIIRQFSLPGAHANAVTVSRMVQISLLDTILHW